MSDTLSEIDGQQVELLPARTVMSLFTVQGGAVGGGFGGSATPIAPVMPVMPLSGLLSDLTGGGSRGLFSGTTGAVGGSGSGPLAPVTGLLSGVTER
jgi:hypothetical protein